MIAERLPPLVAETTARFAPEGMSCGSWVARVERALIAVPGIVAASVNLARQSADVRFAASATREALTAALATAGYPARSTSFSLTVQGMTCSGRVERASLAQPGVVRASANLATRRAAVIVQEGATTAEALAAAVTRAGYAAAPRTTGPPSTTRLISPGWRVTRARRRR